ncbi:hypothetical protein [Streptomyces sp. NPDC014793]|uniref:hypothetical protein n=1 Tax=Streptomyces sp. NPDC014793 TaxID=3364914 RepID=UPI0036F6C9A2
MSFPSGTPTVTLTGTLPSAVAGTGYGGKVVLTPSALLTDEARHAVYPGGGSVDIVDGAFTAQVIPNSAAGILPAGWKWYIDVQPSGAKAKRASFWADISGADGDTIHLDELVPAQAPGGGTVGGGGTGTPGKSAYEIAVDNGYTGTVTQWLASLVGPRGATGATGPAGATGATGAQGPKGDTGAQGPAGATGAQGPKGDPGIQGPAGPTGATGTQGLKGDTGAQGPAGPAGADGAQGPKGDTGLQGPKGDKGDTGPAGAGATLRTATARITDDNLSGLPAAASWAVVLTSAGTPLKASITAAAGDRIRVYGRFMRKGSHFLDWVLLDSAGAIAVYAGTDSSSPLSEGDPALYPSLSFAYETGPPMFTVGAGHIDGTGKATIALAHQGTSTGNANIVYAHSTYPWRLRLENIGPEPT